VLRRDIFVRQSPRSLTSRRVERPLDRRLVGRVAPRRDIFVRQSSRSLTSRRVERRLDRRLVGRVAPRRDIFVRQSPRSLTSRRLERRLDRRLVGRVAPRRDIFVRRVGRVGRVGPQPTCDVCLTSRTLSGRQVATHESSRATSRIPLLNLAVARSRGVGGDTSSRGQKGGVYCRTLSERRVDSWLRLYNLSRTVSDQL